MQALALIVAAALSATAHADTDREEPPPPRRPVPQLAAPGTTEPEIPLDDTLGGTLMRLGLASYTTGWIYDVATAGRAAREYSRDHARPSVAPMAIRGASSTSYAVVPGGSF